MNRTMQQPSRKKNGKYGRRDYLRLVQDGGGDAPRFDPMIDLDNAMHTEYCRVSGRVVSRAIQDVRERMAFPWRYQARRDLELIYDGRPLPEIMRIHDAHREWLVRTYWRVHGRGRAA